MSFLVIGKEAASSGRVRDGQTAFWMSCRGADKFKCAASVRSADTKYLLGGHSAKAAANANSEAGANRVGLLWRAQLLYSNSLNAYVAKFGETDGKVRSAAQKIAAVRPSLTRAGAQTQGLELSTASNLSAQDTLTAMNIPATVSSESRADMLLLSFPSRSFTKSSGPK